MLPCTIPCLVRFDLVLCYSRLVKLQGLEKASELLDPRRAGEGLRRGEPEGGGHQQRGISKDN